MGNKYTDAQAKASRKYIQEQTDQIMIRVPKGEKAKIKEFAEKTGYSSMNEFIVDCIKKRME